MMETGKASRYSPLKSIVVLKWNYIKGCLPKYSISTKCKIAYGITFPFHLQDRFQNLLSDQLSTFFISMFYA